MMILTRYTSAMALACVLACGDNECPAGTMMGLTTCKVPGEPKAAAAGSGGRMAKPWPMFDEAGKGAPSGGSGGGVAGRTPDIGTFHDAGAEDADTGPQTTVRPNTGTSCGNGIVEPGEACDGASCPLTCETGDACMVGKLEGGRLDCSAKCVETQIAECKSDDGCCAPGCTSDEDNDCSATCGNGTIEDLELCDGDCPSTCDDSDVCTADKLSGSATTCNAACMHTKITAPKAGDGCCPAGANATTDSDCKPSCGNGVLEKGETCDGQCPDCDDGNPCTTDTASGSADTCSLTCRHVNRSAGSTCGGDNRCDAMGKCVAPSCGDGRVDDGELCDGNCPATCQAANECQTANVSGQDCQRKCVTANKKAGEFCFGGRGACDGKGKCVQEVWYASCGGQRDCSDALECHPVRHICTAECNADDQCGGSGKCVAGWCEEECAVNADCRTGQDCAEFGSDHICRPIWCGASSPMAACPSGFTCQDPDNNNISECLP